MRESKIVLIILIIFFISSCNIIDNSDDEAINVEYFHAVVDSLILPDSLAFSDTLEIGFCGTLGPNLCYSLSHFEVNSISEGISLKLIGKHVLNTACLQAIAGICDTYKLLVEKQGYFKVKVVNPANSYLIDSVRIY